MDDRARSVNGRNPQHASAYVNWLWLQTESLLNLRWDAVLGVAILLLERKTLTGEEVARVIQVTMAPAAELLAQSRSAKTAGGGNGGSDDHVGN